MSLITDIQVEAKALDYEKFKAKETFGKDVPSGFKPILYGYAQDAFNEAWLRGMKWGWIDINLQSNHQANERMRQAIELMMPLNTKKAIPAPVNGLPRETQIDLQWFSEIFDPLLESHVLLFANVHEKQNLDPLDLAGRIYTFYLGVMNIAWSAGWDSGEAFARSMYEERMQHDPGIRAFVEDTSAVTEENIETLMQLLFIQGSEVSLTRSRAHRGG